MMWAAPLSDPEIRIFPELCSLCPKSLTRTIVFGPGLGLAAAECVP